MSDYIPSDFTTPKKWTPPVYGEENWLPRFCKWGLMLVKLTEEEWTKVKLAFTHIKNKFWGDRGDYSGYKTDIPIRGVKDRTLDKRKQNLVAHMFDKDNVYHPFDHEALCEIFAFLKEYLDEIFPKVMSYLGFDPQKIEELLNNQFENYVVNCYDPTWGDNIGLQEHCDFGWGTALLTTEPVEFQIDGEWISFAPQDGYAFVNFGYALQLLNMKLKGHKKVYAGVHRVPHPINRKVSLVLPMDFEMDYQFLSPESKVSFKEYCFKMFQANHDCEESFDYRNGELPNI